MAVDAATTEMIIARDVAMTTADGVRLVATVYRAKDAPPAPVILMRTPYGKDSAPQIFLIDPHALVRAGFVLVVQDVRGRFASEGVWRPYEADAADGAAAVQWAAALPYCDGQVGMYGASYQGAVALSAAAMRPPALKAIAPLLCFNNPEDGQSFRGGALEFGKLLRWTLMNMPDRLRRRLADPAEAQAMIAQAVADFGALDLKDYRALPLGQHPLLSRYDPDNEVFDYIAAADAGDLRSPAPSPAGARHDIPALWIGGWYDAFMGNMIREFAKDRQAGLDSRLIVGPWTHTHRNRVIADVDFGPAAERIGEAQDSLQDVLIAWFTHTLKGGPFDAPVVQVFTMGANRWRSLERFPSKDDQPLSLFLTQDGGLEAAPGADGVMGFVYDPDDPAPSIGGASLMSAPFSSGPRDQTQVSAREDVLLFRTPALDAPVAAAGWVSAQLWVETTAPSTDFVARVVDIDMDGRQIGVADGILRRNFDPAAGVQALTIDLWATDYVFAAGNRIGLQVTSSAFPRWSRNLNTGEPMATGVAMQRARQTVRLGAAHPSRLCIGPDPAES
jgi:putative CocE/NonD family hydrolase